MTTLKGGRNMDTIKDLKEKLNKICEETHTSKIGIKFLVNYYIKSLGFKEIDAIKYTIGLFENGIIEKIKIIGKDDKEL